MKKKLKKLPGVTLLELIIVMAIFSGIAVGALAMVRPAMQLHYKTAAQERAVAAVDTMARFIQDNLRYADKMFVFTGHGIKDTDTKKGIDVFQDYPFGFENFNDKIEFINQTRDEYTVGGVRFEILRGEKDTYHFVNPVSAFAQYYLEHAKGLYEYRNDYSEAEIKAYFEDKVIYVMEIKNDTDEAEINVYSYSLSLDLDSNPDISRFLLVGSMLYNTEKRRPHSFISNLFSGGKEKINIDKIEIGDDPSKGLNIDLSIGYKGATMPLKLNYNIAVNFMNLTSGSDTIHVNDKYPYNAKRYILFDWKDADQIYSKRDGVSPPAHKPTKEQRAADPGYTYIVYSLPEIIP